MIQFRAKSEDVNIVLTIRFVPHVPFGHLLMSFRTSGTEPKVWCRTVLSKGAESLFQIKYYLEGYGSDSRQVSAILPCVVEHLANEWMKASRNDLHQP